MRTMTIRNIPDSVAAGLAESARASGRSMNAMVVAAMTDAFDKESRGKTKNDFSQFLGVWSKEEVDAFDKAVMESCEEIDADGWPMNAAEASE